MKTFSIFCIGTGHDSTEEYNILTVLHRMTVANDVDNNGGTAVERVSQPNAEHHKVLYDGPPDFPNILAFQEAATDMIQVRDNAVKLIQSVNLPAGRSGREAKITVNLVGHSRGAANCLMIAAELEKQFGSRDCHCNLFLLDPVKVANIANLRPSARIPESASRFIYENVRQVAQIVMEDDVKFAGLIGIFKLYKIEEKPKRPAPDGGERITSLRLPGTHGTATQCNPLISSINSEGVLMPPEKMWPIGGVALSIALDYLDQWGTPLHDETADFMGPANLFHLYNRIQIVNSIVETGSKKRIINNVKLSTAGQTQERNVVPGSGGKTYRSDELLDSFAKNEYRFHPVFINPHHVEICKIVFAEGDGDDAAEALVDMILSQFEIDDSPRNLALAADFRPDIRDDIFDTLKRNILRFPDFFALLKTNGLTWGNQLLDWRLATP